MDWFILLLSVMVWQSFSQKQDLPEPKSEVVQKADWRDATKARICVLQARTVDIWIHFKRLGSSATLPVQAPSIRRTKIYTVVSKCKIKHFSPSIVPATIIFLNAI